MFCTGLSYKPSRKIAGRKDFKQPVVQPCDLHFILIEAGPRIHLHIGGKRRRDIRAEKRNTDLSVRPQIHRIGEREKRRSRRKKAFKRRLKHQKRWTLLPNKGGEKSRGRKRSRSSSTSFQLIKNVALSMNIRPSFIKCVCGLLWWGETGKKINPESVFRLFQTQKERGRLFLFQRRSKRRRTRRSTKWKTRQRGSATWRGANGAVKVLKMCFLHLRENHVFKKNQLSSSSEGNQEPNSRH